MGPDPVRKSDEVPPRDPLAWPLRQTARVRAGSLEPAGWALLATLALFAASWGADLLDWWAMAHDAWELATAALLGMALLEVAFFMGLALTFMLAGIALVAKVRGGPL